MTVVDGLEVVEVGEQAGERPLGALGSPISSLVRIWMAPWLSSPVSESVRAASVASSKASAFGTPPRRGWRSPRASRCPLAPPAAWRRRRATGPLGAPVPEHRNGHGRLDLLEQLDPGDTISALVVVRDRGLARARASSGHALSRSDPEPPPVGVVRGSRWPPPPRRPPLASPRYTPLMSAPSATVASRQRVSSTARRSRCAFSALAARASALPVRLLRQAAAHLERAQPGRGLVRHRVGELDLLLAEPARRLADQHDHGSHHARVGQRHVEQARGVEPHRSWLATTGEFGASVTLSGSPVSITRPTPVGRSKGISYRSPLDAAVLDAGRRACRRPLARSAVTWQT